MKAVNVIIVSLVIALAYSTYMLVTKILPKGENAVPTVATSKEPKKIPVNPYPPDAQQADRQVTMPAPPPPQPAKPATQGEPSNTRQLAAEPHPPVKEEPKLRSIKDIKVVMYMTDW
ncbi:MAG TPA: hypothetical protein VK452_09370 [Dissulfurispiraceae bacterium]|nr:hypothetical protein [Dissulfurispiraceae bacterium]